MSQALGFAGESAGTAPDDQQHAIFITVLGHFNLVRIHHFAVGGHRVLQGFTRKLLRRADPMVVCQALRCKLQGRQSKHVATVIQGISVTCVRYPVGQLIADFVVQRLLINTGARFQEVRRQIRQSGIAFFQHRKVLPFHGTKRVQILELIIEQCLGLCDKDIAD
ncbi:hypothetical protein D3C76_1020390 [compost metagenome]